MNQLPLIPCLQYLAHRVSCVATNPKQNCVWNIIRRCYTYDGSGTSVTDTNQPNLVFVRLALADRASFRTEAHEYFRNRRAERDRVEQERREAKAKRERQFEEDKKKVEAEKRQKIVDEHNRLDALSAQQHALAAARNVCMVTLAIPAAAKQGDKGLFWVKFAGQPTPSRYSFCVPVLGPGLNPTKLQINVPIPPLCDASVPPVPFDVTLNGFRVPQEPREATSSPSQLDLALRQAEAAQQIAASAAAAASASVEAISNAAAAASSSASSSLRSEAQTTSTPSGPTEKPSEVDRRVEASIRAVISRPSKFQWNVPKRGGGVDDDDLVETNYTVSLIDQFSMKKIEIPCRSTLCNHQRTCFDLRTFLKNGHEADIAGNATRHVSRNWRCPTCAKPGVYPDNLKIDEWFERLLATAPPDATSVDVDAKTGMPPVKEADKAASASSSSSAGVNGAIDLDGIKEGDSIAPIVLE